MDKKTRSRQTLIVALALAAAVLLLLFGAFLISRRSNRNEQIHLPDPPAPAEQPVIPEAQGSELMQISSGNALDVLKSLSRPSSYHRTAEIQILSDAGQTTQTVEMWVNQDLVRADIITAFDNKHILTDGKTLYLWYDGEESIELTASEGMSVEDLAGIPDYESILGFPIRSLLDAKLVQMDQNEGTGTVYVSAAQSDVTLNYWISLDTGLLFKQEMLQDDQQIYALDQVSLEILADGDDAFLHVFCLPDGSEPFTAE